MGGVSTFAVQAFDATGRALRGLLRRWNAWHAKAGPSVPPSDLPMDAPVETIHPRTSQPLAASRDMDVYGEPL